MADSLHVRIRKVHELVWEGEASSVSSENAQGPFDILPMHANFITLLKKPITIEEMSGKKHTFNFQTSVLHVVGNTVSIYVDLDNIS